MRFELIGLLCLLLGSFAGTPKAWNWRDNNGVTDVKDQGACNAGWAFATTAAYEALLLRTSKTTYNLSEQYLIQCSGAGDCGGLTRNIVKAVDFAAANGIPTRANLPYSSMAYTSGKAPENGACSIGTVKAGGKVTNRVYQYVSSGFMKKQVYKGVIISGLYMGAALRAFTGTGVYKCIDTVSYRNSNVNNDAQQPWMAKQFNHYVLVVGYDSSTNFIIKNSLGLGWGSLGFGKLANGYDCGIRILPQQLSGWRMAGVLLMMIVLAWL